MARNVPFRIIEILNYHGRCMPYKTIRLRKYTEVLNSKLIDLLDTLHLLNLLFSNDITKIYSLVSKKYVFQYWKKTGNSLLLTVRAFMHHLERFCQERIKRRK